jgi:hypothetical protein
MGNQRTIGIVVLVVGSIVLAVSLLADPIGIGGSPKFGYLQIAGTIVGVIVTVIGLVITLKG